MALQAIKVALTKLGRLTSAEMVYKLNAAVNYLEVGRWMWSHGFQPSDWVGCREELFDCIAREVADERVLYLEFGVFRGESIAYWSRLLRNPASYLHGFDSFEGLPETWSSRAGQGFFSTGGAIPITADPRVTFFKGWFKDTLPAYSPPDHDRLVVNIDVDLYSSTALALDAIRPILKLGDFLYFDEFSDRFHELKAFDEFLSSTGMRFRAVGATKVLTQVGFQRTQ